MDTSDYQLIQKFNDAFGHIAPIQPELLDIERLDHQLHYDLIKEEFDELTEAFVKNDSVNYADALIDLIVVIFGDLHNKGWDYRLLMEEVMRANFSKLDDDGNPIYREDGKILKGPHYIPPDLSPYLPVRKPVEEGQSYVAENLS